MGLEVFCGLVSLQPNDFILKACQQEFVPRLDPSGTEHLMLERRIVEAKGRPMDFRPGAIVGEEKRPFALSVAPGLLARFLL